MPPEGLRKTVVHYRALFDELLEVRESEAERWSTGRRNQIVEITAFVSVKRKFNQSNPTVWSKLSTLVSRTRSDSLPNLWETAFVWRQVAA